MKYLTQKEILADPEKYPPYINCDRIIQNELYHVVWGESKGVVGKCKRILTPTSCIMQSPKGRREWMHPVLLKDMFYTKRTSFMLYAVSYILEQDTEYMFRKIHNAKQMTYINNNDKRYKPQIWSAKEWLWFYNSFIK